MVEIRSSAARWQLRSSIKSGSPRYGTSLACLALCGAMQAQSYTFTRFSGVENYLNHGRPAVDGAGAGARFNQPLAITRASDGSFFVLDRLAHSIRRVSQAGDVRTYCGREFGNEHFDGPADLARFSYPQGMAIDAGNNLYVSDGDHSIRKISSAGFVTTIAGPTDRSFGHADGAGGAARFRQPWGLAIGDDDTVFVADLGNHTIRRITPSGLVTTYAGQPGEEGDNDGPRAVARFRRPSNLLFDGAGNLLVLDEPDRLRVISPDGTVRTSARLPFTIAAFARDRDGSLIMGTETGIWRVSALASGSPTIALIAPTPDWIAAGLALGSDGGFVAVDPWNAVVRRIDPTGAVTILAGTTAYPQYLDGGRDTARFCVPSALAIDRQGNLYVGDEFNACVRKVLPTGEVTTLAGAPQSGLSAIRRDGTGRDARFLSVESIAADAAGNVYVGEGTVLRRISPDGVVTTLAGSAGTDAHRDGIGGEARFRFINAVAIDSHGIIHVSDTGLIRRVTPGGAVSTLAGSYPPGALVDGSGSRARFISGAGLAIDPVGNIFVADDTAVRKVSPAGVVTTIAGSSSSGWVDATGAEARFFQVRSIVLEPGGALLAGDITPSIRRVTPEGVVTTLGSSQNAFYPSGLAIDEEGRLFVGDSRSASIQVGTPSDPAAPLIVRHPMSYTVLPGTEVIHSIVIDGDDISYQWKKDGLVIPGATRATHRVSSFQAQDAGLYSVVASNPRGAAESRPAVMTLYTGRRGKLANLAVRSVSGSGSDALVAGFQLMGSPRPVLLRGIGPSLGRFGVAGGVPDPTIRLAGAPDGRIVAQNDNWDETMDLSSIERFSAAVGAFPLGPSGKDAAILQTISAGAYTVEMGGGSGQGLLEVYDAGAGELDSLANMSARSHTGAGANILTAGFVVRGPEAAEVLIRGIGRSLALFGIEAPLPDPVVELYQGTTLIATNDDWNGLSPEFADAGAFAIPRSSPDAALTLTLPPGNYTVQVSGAGAAAGVALVEIYLMPPRPRL